MTGHQLRQDDFHKLLNRSECTRRQSGIQLRRKCTSLEDESLRETVQQSRLTEKMMTIHFFGWWWGGRGKEVEILQTIHVQFEINQMMWCELDSEINQMWCQLDSEIQMWCQLESEINQMWCQLKSEINQMMWYQLDSEINQMWCQLESEINQMWCQVKSIRCDVNERSCRVLVKWLNWCVWPQKKRCGWK